MFLRAEAVDVVDAGDYIGWLSKEIHHWTQTIVQGRESQQEGSHSGMP